MSLKAVLHFSRTLRMHGVKNSRRLFASESKGEMVITADENPIYETDNESNEEYQKELARKRNKSRLYPQHRNMLLNLEPYSESMAWYHNTVKYKRRMLGRYGIEAVGMHAGVAWPSLKELEDIKEYERVSFPTPLHERWNQLAEDKRKSEEERRAREMDVLSKMKQMKKWITEVQNKVSKKEEDLRKAKERKERLIEEVRAHFGFKIQVHDERFQEMLLKKEKEDKKKLKEAKKAAREEKFAQKVAELYKIEGIPTDGAPIVTPKTPEEPKE